VAYLVHFLDYLEDSAAIDLVLAGYSYGSLIASRTPKFSDILNMFKPEDLPRFAEEIVAKANACASQILGKQASNETPVQKVSMPNDSASKTKSKLSEKSIDVSYLLVSPLLPPISTLISLPFGSNSNNIDHMQKFKERRTFAVWGDQDIFTSAAKLRNWAEDLHQQNQNFVWIEVQGASHFWREDGVIELLILKVGEFVKYAIT
jgi:alpha/beta superfamily hydrolase